MNTQITPNASMIALTKPSILPPATVLPTPATKEEINALHLQFSEYGRNAKEWIRKCQLLLPRIRDEEVWKKKGFGSIHEYAAKLAGMSHSAVDDALFVLEKIDDKPHLKKIVEARGVNAVRPVVTIVTRETEKFWAKRVEEMSNNTLREYVAGIRRNRDLLDEIKSRDIPGQRVEGQDEDMSNEAVGESQTHKIAMYMKLEVEVIEKLKQIKGDRDWNELMKDLLEGKFENIGMGEDGRNEGKMAGDGGLSKSKEVAEKSEKPAPVNTGKRYVPKKIQKYVTKKTSGLCAYPGCGKPYDILHHTKRFVLDSTHDPETLRPLCKAHERLAHKGLIGNEDAEPVKWALRTEPNTHSPKYEIDEKVNDYYMPQMLPD